MITSLALKNWKSHSNAQFDFEPGVNVIVGPMGAGKSSILQAITFALFGTFSEVKSRDIKVNEIITRGPTASATRIELTLEKGKQYKIQRIIDKQKGTGDATISSEDVLLAGPKPTAVNDFVKDLLKIDEDTFLRTVYAQQNDIDLFLKYSPAERKRRLDELMHLDKFETVRKNATKLANQIQVQQEENIKFVSGIEIDSIKTEADALQLEISKVELERKTYSAQVEKSIQDTEIIRTKLTLLRDKKLKQNLLKQRKDILQLEIAETEKKLKNIILEETKENLLLKLSCEKEKAEALKNDRNKLRIELEEKDSERSLLEKQVAVLDSKRGELASTENEIIEFEKQILGSENIDSEVKQLEEKLEESRRNQQAADAKVNTIIEHLSELKEADSTCPICSTILTEEKKAELSAQRKQEIMELSKEAKEFKKIADEIVEELKAKKTIQEQTRDVKNRVTELKRRAADLNLQLAKIDDIKKRKEELFHLLDVIRNKINLCESNIELSQKIINELTEIKSLYDLKDRFLSIKSEFTKVDMELSESSFKEEELLNIENQYVLTLKKSQEISTRTESLDLLIKEKGKRLFEINDKIVRIEKILSEINVGRGKVDFLKRFNNAVLTAQESLRSELIRSVNDSMNKIWVDLYPYEKWTGIKLEASGSDYSLQLQDKTGEWLSVAGFASGGERMLSALAMRIAFSKVLSPGFNMLILDEPTHNLDQNAIRTFTDVVENKLANYLDQVFIITHEEKLAEIGNPIKLE